MEKRESNCRKMIRRMCCILFHFIDKYVAFEVDTSKAYVALDMLKAGEPVDPVEKASCKERLYEIVVYAYNIGNVVYVDKYILDDLWKKFRIDVSNCSCTEIQGSGKFKDIYGSAEDLYHQFKDILRSVSFLYHELNAVAGQLGWLLKRDTLDREKLNDDWYELFYSIISSIDDENGTIREEIKSFQGDCEELKKKTEEIG